MENKKKVLLVVTMDTKGKEAKFVKSCLEDAGVATVIMDAGILGNCKDEVEISREEVARGAGCSLEEVRGMGHEGRALGVMIEGAIKLAVKLYQDGEIDGIMGVGGSMGTTLGTSIMRTMPVGFPKLMVSTMASRNTRPFVGTKDIMMLHSVCDLSGLNRITRTILRNGALAIAGMVKKDVVMEPGEKPIVVLSTLGTTEACAIKLRTDLESRGYEVIIFHTVGSGGQAMDEFVDEHGADFIIDLSLHELMDHLFGGDYDAGPERGKVGARNGIPTILVPGNMDFLVTGPIAEAEKYFPGRKTHSHNAAITAVRARREELKKAGKIIGDICNEARGAISVLIPEKGFSAFDCPDGPLYDPNGAEAFEMGINETIKDRSIVKKVPAHINDEAFSKAVLKAFDSLLRRSN